MISQEEFLKIANNLKKAEEDDTPFVVVKDNEIAVVGDANKTQQKKRDYVISFRFPMSDQRYLTPESRIIKDCYITDIIYKDVFVNPRKDLEVIGAMMTILGYYKKIKEDGTIEDRTPEDLFKLFALMESDVVDAMYKFVSVVLGVNEELVDNMLASSVINTCSKIIEDYPEIVNEADVFFG